MKLVGYPLESILSWDKFAEPQRSAGHSLRNSELDFQCKSLLATPFDSALRALIKLPAIIKDDVRVSSCVKFSHFISREVYFKV